MNNYAFGSLKRLVQMATTFVRASWAVLILSSLIVSGCGGSDQNSATQSNTGVKPGQDSEKKNGSQESQMVKIDSETITRQQFIESGSRCGTRPVLPVEARGIQRRIDNARGEDLIREAAAGPIKVYFHVINKGTDPLNDGNIDQQLIESQMKLLNDSYASTHFKFELVKVDRTTKADWYDMDMSSPEEAAAKQSLGAKQKGVLNIYTAHLAGSILGWAVFPWDFSADPYDDGVVIRFSTLPGGTSVPYDQGKTLVHEVGHWLGLYHTFQGGCSALGDYVDDTPAEKQPAFECQPGLDTCPDTQGTDPIENYMDYTPDSCMNRFTSGQAVRMDAMFSLYRE